MSNAGEFATVRKSPALGKSMARSQVREPQGGRFAFDGDQSRMCRCGHRLGLHIAGGFECGTTRETLGCNCERFRLRFNRTRKAARS